MGEGRGEGRGLFLFLVLILIWGEFRRRCFGLREGSGLLLFCLFFHSLCSFFSSFSGTTPKIDIVFLFSCRDADLCLLFDVFLSHLSSSSLPNGITFQGKVFHSLSPSFSSPSPSLPSPSLFSKLEKEKERVREGGDWDFLNRRIERGDVGEVEGLKEREVYMCGPKGLEDKVVEWVEGEGVEGRIHREDFDF